VKRCEDVEILEGSDSNFDVCEGSQQSKHKNGCEDFRGDSDQPVLSVPVVLNRMSVRLRTTLLTSRVVL